MKNIQSINIWNNGEMKQAIKLSLKSTDDNLETQAKFYYQLLSESEVLTVGDLIINGEDYQSWGNQSGVSINDWAYNWVANKLNLTII